ncbi:hypothetical protein [Mycobacterium sp. 94-17]|uniref:hypothetical protein n=1 Tax=Mycobacterium sp. 94-17 TaxID=2986147 RepID=UPI002D1EA438|nr:hypothetical protein [Mycobacterium sp. 94-17]MEB4209316.1 hypothetical protein [Mycobacterium sp. 94-17]
MTNHRPPIVFAAALLLAGGLFALYYPVFIDAYDQFGWQIKCGNGFAADLAQASRALSTAGDNVVGRCDSALIARRLWAIPMAVLGAAILTWESAAALAHDYHRPIPSGDASQSARVASQHSGIPCE